MAYPVVGDFNVCESWIGARGSGKSTDMARRARELQHFQGALIVGHSIGQRLPRTLPDGYRLPLEYHRSVDECDRGLRRHPERWQVVAPPTEAADTHPDLPRSSADDVIRYAVRLSVALREKAWKEAHPWAIGIPKKGVNFDGLSVAPVVVIIDEGVALAGAAGGDRAKNGKTDWFNETLISLRHYHIGLLYSIQSPTLRSWHMLEQSTVIRVFQLRHMWALNNVQAAGATPAQMEQIKRLGKFESVEVSAEATDTEYRSGTVPEIVATPDTREIDEVPATKT